MRRQLILGGFNISLLLAVSSAVGRAEGVALVPAHCQLIQSDELQAIVGDCARSGMGGPQYCGLWSLTSKQQQFNCFGNPRDLRFFCSPSGGGGSLLPNQSCPAWDFLWIIPAEKYQAGKEYAFRVRLIYKPYLSDQDVLAEAAKARKEMETEP